MMFAREQAPFTCAAAFFMTLQPILVTLSKNRTTNKFDYSVPGSTFLSEALKLCISGTLLVRQRCREDLKLLHEDSLTEFMSYMIPGLIYFINNNTVFLILQAVDPTTFQLLSQLKTIFTGLLFRAFLSRRLTLVQWLALFTLACGTAVSQIPSSVKYGKHAHAHTHTHASFMGIGLSVLSAFLSACGGIYNEKLLKGRPTSSLHWQNVQMYIWGVVSAWENRPPSLPCLSPLPRAPKVRDSSSPSRHFPRHLPPPASPPPAPSTTNLTFRVSTRWAHTSRMARPCAPAAC